MTGVGNMSEKTIEKRALEWLFSRDTGASSKAICAHMLGTSGQFSSYPSDPSDLGRCIRLLELIPEWKSRIQEMAVHGPGWAGQVKQWDSLVDSMADEVGINWGKGDRAPITYNAMKLAQAAGYRENPDWTCRFDKNGHLCSAQRKAK